MITVTIKDVLEEILPDCSEHFIYRFYDGETTFYIGKSFEIEERLSTHLGIGNWPRGSRILDIVNDNLPDSLNWPIDLYTLRDCAEALQEHLVGWNIEALFSPQFLEMAVEKSEIAMMRRYHPCLNTLNNKRASSLPAKYSHARPGMSPAQFLKV